MYKELVDRLRTDSLYKDKATLEIMDLCMDAAEAIERLLSELERVKREREEQSKGCEYCYTDAKSNPFVGGYNYCPMCGRELKGADNG